jgi:hypothetical protein
MTYRTSLLVAVVAGALAGCGAEDNPYDIGRRCDLGLDVAAIDGVALAMPSIDCGSRMCLAYVEPAAAAPKPERGHCTAECVGVAGECDPGPDVADCAGGFVCAVTFTRGVFCCRPMCVCADDLAELPSVDAVQGACDADDPDDVAACPSLAWAPLPERS